MDIGGTEPEVAHGTELKGRSQSVGVALIGVNEGTIMLGQGEIDDQVPLRGCLKSLHGFLQRYPHAMVIVDFRELRTIVTSSEAALHQLKTLMSGLFKQPLRAAARRRSTGHCKPPQAPIPSGSTTTA